MKNARHAEHACRNVIISISRRMKPRAKLQTLKTVCTALCWTNARGAGPAMFIALTIAGHILSSVHDGTSE